MLISIYSSSTYIYISIFTYTSILYSKILIINAVFILKVSENSSKKRLKKRKSKNRYDNFAQSFYSKAQKSFMKIAKNKKNYFILNSSSNDDILEHKIFNITKKFLKIK